MSVKDRLTINYEGKEVELVMSYNHLITFCDVFQTSLMNGDSLEMVEPINQEIIFQKLLEKKEGVEYVGLDSLSIEDALAVTAWVMNSVLDFFMRFQKVTSEELAPRIKEIEKITQDLINQPSNG